MHVTVYNPVFVDVCYPYLQFLLTFIFDTWWYLKWFNKLKGQWLKVETNYWDCFTLTYRENFMWNQYTGSGNVSFMKLYWKRSTVKNRTKTTSVSVAPSIVSLRLFGCFSTIFDWFHEFSVIFNLFSVDF